MIFERGELAQRNCSSVWQRDLQGSQGRERDALFIGRARHDVDQIDIIAHLSDRCPGYDSVKHRRHCLGAQTQQSCFILIDADANLARRFNPVKIDLLRLRVCCDDLGKL